jgi:hypothetical protein
VDQADNGFRGVGRRARQGRYRQEQGDCPGRPRSAQEFVQCVPHATPRDARNAACRAARRRFGTWARRTAARWWTWWTAAGWWTWRTAGGWWTWWTTARRAGRTAVTSSIGIRKRPAPLIPTLSPNGGARATAFCSRHGILIRPRGAPFTSPLGERSPEGRVRGRFLPSHGTCVGVPGSRIDQQ